MLKITQTQMKRFTEWFLTGHTSLEEVTPEEQVVNDIRKQMKEQLQQLQSRGLPIRIVTL